MGKAESKIVYHKYSATLKCTSDCDVCKRDRDFRSGKPVIFRIKIQWVFFFQNFSHLVSSLVNISGRVVVHSEHRDQAIRITICLKK